MPKNITRKSELKKLDDAWKMKVKKRDNHICQVCGNKLIGKNCHAHHILPKGVKGCRWDINNGITLCFPHHKVGLYSAHLNAVWFTFWLKTHKFAQFRFIISKLEHLNKR